jgi:hypothetical protein
MMNRRERKNWVIERALSERGLAKVTPQRAGLIRSWIDGEDIEFMSNYDGVYWGDAASPSWDPDMEYRIKVEEVIDAVLEVNLEPLITLKMDVEVSDNLSNWYPAILHEIDKVGTYPYVSTAGIHRYCRPRLDHWVSIANHCEGTSTRTTLDEIAATLDSAGFAVKLDYYLLAFKVTGKLEGWKWPKILTRAEAEAEENGV